MLSSISFASQLYEGASASLWFAGVQVGGTVTVFTLSVFKGQGKFLTHSEIRVLALSAFGLILWYVSETAVFALAISITISLLGGMMTVVKAYHVPQSETLSTWMLGLVASLCGAISVGAWDPILLAYPFYLITLYSAISLAIVIGRAKARGPRRVIQPRASL